MRIFSILFFFVLIPCVASADLNNGLIIYYSFEGDTDDHSGLDNHGTAEGGITYSIGKIGNAAEFDGTDDFIRVPYNSSMDPPIFSIAVWVKINQEDDVGVISSTNGGVFPDCDHGYTLRVRSDDVRFNTDESAGCGDGEAILSDVEVDDGYWHHIVAIYDGTMRLYIDGQLQSDTSTNNYSRTNRNLLIGAKRTYTTQTVKKGYITGHLDEFRLYNRALSQSEICELAGCDASSVPSLNELGILILIGTLILMGAVVVHRNHECKN
jgi:hypothetical protein